jgi:hypothetical protein
MRTASASRTEVRAATATDVRRSMTTAAMPSATTMASTAAVATATTRRCMNRERHHSRQKDGGNACCKF